MKFPRFFFLSLVTVVCGLYASSVSAAVVNSVAFVTPKNTPNGSSSIPSGTTYTSNLGYAFITGSSGPFDIDWITMGLTSAAAQGSTVSFKISIHGTDNGTAYSAVASSTVYASDIVTFTTPNAANTPFDKTFTAADIPNITGFTGFRLESNKAYSMFVNSSSGAGIALRRKNGLAANTNDEYTVTNGFVMLDTFRNNTPNYQSVAGSYVTFDMSFGGTASASGAVPEPTTMALWTLLVGGGLVRGYRNKASRR